MVYDFTFDVADMRSVGPKPKLLTIYFGPIFWMIVLVGISTILGPPLWTTTMALPDLMALDLDELPLEQQQALRNGYIAIGLAVVLIIGVLGIFFWSVKNANRTRQRLRTNDPQKLGVTEGLHFGPGSVSFDSNALKIERAFLSNATKRDGIAAVVEDRGVFFMKLRTGARVPLGRLTDPPQQSDFNTAADNFMAGEAQ